MTGVLRDRNFRRFFGGQALSTFGDNAMFLAFAIWVKQLTGSSSAAGAVFFAFLAPSTLASPALGYLADRVRRRPLMVATNLASAVVVLPLLAVHDRSQIWIVYGVAVLLGVSNGLLSAARNGLLKDLVTDEQLVEANAALRTATDGLQFLSPLVGAGLFAALGGGAVAAVDAFTFLVAAGALLATRVHESPRDASAEPTGQALLGGVRHIRQSPALRRVITTVACACLVLGFGETVIIVVVDQGLHRAPEFLGVLASLGGLGAIAGGVTAVRVIRRLGELRAAAAGMTLFAVGCLLQTTGMLGIVLAAELGMGVGVPWIVVGFMTLMQRATPPGLQGRVGAAANVAVSGCQTVSVAVGAMLVAVVDYRVLLVIVAAVLAGCAVRLGRALPAAPTAQAGALATATSS